MTFYLHKMFSEAEQHAAEGFGAETAKVATTATDPDDDVFVTLPNSGAPTTPIEVKWRPQVQFVASVAEPLYPQRGDEGIVIYSDTGVPWLIW